MARQEITTNQCRPLSLAEPHVEEPFACTQLGRLAAASARALRIETSDFDAGKEQHGLHARNRTPYGITDGQAYQDLDNPGAATFHIRADDIDTAMAWFRSDTNKHPS